MMLLKVGEGIIGLRSPLRQHPFRGKGAGPHRLQLCVCVEGRNQACVSPGATPPSGVLWTFQAIETPVES